MSIAVKQVVSPVKQKTVRWVPGDNYAAQHTALPIPRSCPEPIHVIEACDCFICGDSCWDRSQYHLNGELICQNCGYSPTKPEDQRFSWLELEEPSSIMSLDFEADDCSSDSLYEDIDPYLTPATSVDSSRVNLGKTANSDRESYEQFQRGYSGSTLVERLHMQSPNTSNPTISRSTMPPTPEEEEEMAITPIDGGIRDRDFASYSASSRGRNPFHNQRIQRSQPLQYHPQTHQQLQGQGSVVEQVVSIDSLLEAPTFHDRVIENFDPIREAASSRSSIRSVGTRPGSKRWSILSMQQQAAAKPQRPYAWYEREESASFQLKIAPRGRIAKPVSASSATAIASSANSSFSSQCNNDWENPINDPEAFARVLVMALFTSNLMPRAESDVKQHGFSLVPTRAPGASHFAMRHVKPDPLTGKVAVGAGEASKRIQWQVKFKVKN